jgi:hypothetical protein
MESGGLRASVRSRYKKGMILAATDVVARVAALVGAVTGTTGLVMTFVRGRRRVVVGLAGTGHVSDDNRFLPLAEVTVVSHGRNLSIDHIELEWMDEIPLPGGPWFEPARPRVTGAPIRELPLPARDGETIRLLFEVGVHPDWDGHHSIGGYFPDAVVRVHVRMSNRSRPYISNEERMWFWQDKSGEDIFPNATDS